MYIENKDGEIDGYQARVGWVTFSKSGLSIYYRDWRFGRLKKRGGNRHRSKIVSAHIDEDALNEYNKIKNIWPHSDR